ncbi:hypothetical protein OG225_40335 (plasmid) [Nocardia sp. NBC_01377]|uniref:hypothetical protein n=1 Tax=Nocardia sp. NBC_01377 TaxID=2903595 RepID=UPI002F9175C0
MSFDRPDLSPAHTQAARSRTAGLWTAEPFDTADPADVCNPNHYEGKTDSWVEQVLRADFARYHQLRDAADRSNSPAEIQALTTRAAAIETPGLDRANSWTRTWEHAVEVRTDWIDAPDTMSHRLGALEEERIRGWHTLTDLELRTLYQLRELTGNGIWDQTQSPTESDRPVDAQAAQIIEAALVPELRATSHLHIVATDPSEGADAERFLEEGPGR